ncbi:MAG TPA: LamG-like jellyroll fold domain-containing protein [Verrucomicrobiae bacterium]|nr:LamG-like jellyroll fold domain-containing protein [Verrucomicrobiae bacterium]
MKPTQFATIRTLYFATVATLAGFACLRGQPAFAGPSVVGLWRFEEASGTTALDSSGLGNNGTLAGENGNVPVRAAGQAGFGNALVITNDGTDHSYVTIPDAPSLLIGQTATNAWSITAWVYENSDGTGDFIANYGRILTIDDGSTFQLESGASGDSEMYTWSAITTPWQVAWGVGNSVAPLLDQWVHWAVVYDGTNLTIYRNANQGPEGGVSSTPVSSPLAFPGYTGSIIIGSELDQPAAVTWNGMLDDIAVFAGALSPSQVATVMSGNFTPFLGGAPGIVSQPQSQSVPQGSTASFSVGASGQTPLSYQWYHGTNKISAVSNPTATNATLVLNNLQFSQSGVYSAVVSNSISSVTSSPASLQVFSGTLVGLWRFNEASGTNALDSSGLGNTGALAGENGNVPGRVTGMAGFGGALRFTNNGADHAYVAVPANGSLAIGQTATNPWTITAWAYEDSDGTGDFVATYGRILTIDNGTAFQFESGASGDSEMYTWDRASGLWEIPWGIGSSVSPLLDQWVHWAVVYDGTNISVYRDGNTGPDGGIASQPVNAALGGYLGYSDAILIGTELAQTADRNWNGMLDDIAVFNIPLSQAQIQTVMGGDFSAFVPRPVLSIHPSPSQTVLSWSAMQPTFQLQSANSVTSPSWTNVPTGAVQNGNSMTVTLPPAVSGPKYFRLIGP